MSAAEALHHRDEALLHLRQLREAHALSTAMSGRLLVLHPSTVSTGAAMLATTPAAVGGARLASRNAAAPLRAAASKGNPIFALNPRGRAYRRTSPALRS